MPKKPSGKVGADGKIALTIRLDQSTWEKIDAKAKDKGGKSLWIGLLIDQFLDQAKLKLEISQAEGTSTPPRRPEVLSGAKQEAQTGMILDFYGYWYSPDRRAVEHAE
jgi:hypothetical protein